MKKALLSLIGGLVLLFILLFTVDGGGSDFSLFLGRFHPILVHLPIGILLMALLLEGLTRLPRFAAYDKAIPVVFLVGAWSAILAAIAGIYLSQGGGYDAWTLDWHKRLGIAVAVIATLAYALRERAQRPGQLHRGYVTLMVILFIGIAFGGHLGGELTHGEGYLTRYMPNAFRSIAGLPAKEDLGRLQLDNPEEASTYTALIQPILDARCVACHGEQDAKGALKLDSQEALLEGGEDGEVLVAGRADESELIRRIWLPESHDDHMPPEGRPQVSVAEAELIRWWIDQGASFEQTLAEAEMTPTIQTILDGYGLDEIRTGIFALDVPAADSVALATLQAAGVSVLPLAEEEPFLQVRCLDAADCLNGEQASALLAVAPQVAWLDLGRAQVNDSSLAVLANLEHLTRLHLERTSVTDAGLAHLKGLSYLEYLNLYGTAVTDAGLEHLTDLPALRALYLWQTGVTEEAAQRLQQTLPDLDINLGLSLTTPVQETAE